MEAKQFIIDTINRMEISIDHDMDLINDDELITNIGLDSLHIVEIAMEIEKHKNIVISDIYLEQCSTWGQLINLYNL